MYPSPQRHVIHVLGELRFSGAERSLQDATPHFLQAGISLHIVSLGWREGDFAPILKAAGYQVYWIPATGGKATHTPVALCKAVWHFYQLCKSRRFDVVHIHLESAFLLWVLAAKWAGVPAIFRTVHNCFDVFSPWLTFRKKWERQLALALGTRFLAVSERVALTEKTCFQVPATTVAPYIDLSHFARTTPLVRRPDLHLPEEKTPVLLAIGRLVPEKGYALLLDALADVPGVCLAILGEGPEKDRLWAKAKKLGLENRFLLLGNQSDVATWLSAACVFLMPSRYEGLGLVVWEAMAAGLPLLLADLPVLREAAFGQGTFLPLQPEAWAQAIRKALENPECCAQEGQQNRETVLRHVRPTGSLHQLITLYHSAK